MANKNLYLVAYYAMKPKNSRIKTHVSGWMKDMDNVGYDEQIAVTTKIKNKDISMAKIILDLTNETVVRNGWGNEKSYYELYNYFYSKYQKELNPAIAQLRAKQTNVTTEQIVEPVVTETTMPQTGTVASGSISSV